MPQSAESALRAALESISGLMNCHDKADAKRIAADALAAHPEESAYTVLTVAEGTKVVLGWRGVVVTHADPMEVALTEHVYTDREAARRAAEELAVYGKEPTVTVRDVS